MPPMGFGAVAPRLAIEAIPVFSAAGVGLMPERELTNAATAP
jgi:hypothetical protein